METKFKIGDIIRVSNVKDYAHRYNHFYKITKTYKNGYDLLSLTTNEKRSFRNIAKRLAENGEDMTVKNFIETHYRLVTEAELVLYGRKEV